MSPTWKWADTARISTPTARRTKDTRTLRQDDARQCVDAGRAASTPPRLNRVRALDESPFLSRAALLDRKLHGSAQPGRHAGDALRPGLEPPPAASRQDRV